MGGPRWEGADRIAHPADCVVSSLNRTERD
jgi:hypothetical protein